MCVYACVRNHDQNSLNKLRGMHFSPHTLCHANSVMYSALNRVVRVNGVARVGAQKRKTKKKSSKTLCLDIQITTCKARRYQTLKDGTPFQCARFVRRVRRSTARESNVFFLIYFFYK